MNFNFVENICVDFGSGSTSIYVPGKGLALRERTMLLKNIHTGELVSAGDEAAALCESLPQTLRAVYPVSGGAVRSVTDAAELLSAFILRIRKNKLIKPRIMLSVPGDATEVEGKAFAAAAMNSGARQAILISAPTAAALGAGCDVTLSRGLMTADIGAEKTDVAAISQCNCVTARTIKIGGNDFTLILKEFVKTKFKLEISFSVAEKAKKELGLSQSPQKTIELCGIDVSNKMPRKITPPATMFSGIYDNLINKLSTFVKDAFDDVPTALAGDILSDGILLTGGGAQLGGLAERLKFGSGIKTFVANEPELCNIKGTGLAFEHSDELAGMVQSYHNL